MNEATLLDAIHSIAEIRDRGFIFLSNELTESSYSFADLVAEARLRGARLLEMGLRKGDRLGMVIPESEDFVLSFLGALTVGVVPVPMYPPLALGRLDSYVEGAGRILGVARARMLLTTKKVAPILWSLTGKVPSLEDIVTADQLKSPRLGPAIPVEVSPEDPCFLQFTSGSTSDPKGVVVTHGSLIANAKAIMRDGLKTDGKSDRGVSWLPLYHDMGLIGFVLSPLINAVPVVFLPTLAFVKRPALWMETVARYQGTITFAPNFAFALAAKYAVRHPKEMDVSSLRVVGCGAEPIHPGTLRRFEEALRPHGLNPHAIMPCYGMAEATLAMAFDSLEAPFSSVTIEREAYEEQGHARQVFERVAAQEALELVACGSTFPGHELGIMGPAGELLGDHRVGEIVFRGPSVAAGYFEQPAATEEVLKAGWLHTGDLGFTIDGVLYVSGRKKDLIILNGRNYHPQAIEWAVEAVEGIRKGNVVAFTIPGAETEHLVIAAETGAPEPALKEAVQSLVKADLGLNVHDVVLLPKGALPKTSSGKLQRGKTRATYQAGELGKEDRTFGGHGTKVTVARHLTRGVVAKMGHVLKRRVRALKPEPPIKP